MQADQPASTENNSTMRMRFQSVWRVARTVAIAYVLICLLMMAMETTLVYPAPVRIGGPPAPIPDDIEEVWFESADGTRIHGLFMPYEDSQRALLYCHGNAENMSQGARYVRQLRNTYRASTLVFAYRGYGLSEGRPHEEGIVQDGMAAQQWLADRVGVSTEDTFIKGRSLGAALAVGIASRQGARGIVLIGAFASMPDVAASHYPWLPVRWLMRNRYPAESWIKNYPGSVLQFHATRDEIIPFEHGTRLFEAAPTRNKKLMELAGTHNTPLPDFSEPMINNFFDRLDEQ
jgi:fermentation-respiration switch protein FrsA (DUF1100 family)